MKLIEANPSELTDRSERATAKLARIARGNTYLGGASALVIAKRLERMGCKFPALECVSDIYSRSNGSLGEYGAYKCPECGCVHLGQSAALNCCAESDFEDNE